MVTQSSQCQKLISKYEQQTQEANNTLFLEAQKIVDRFCEQWGLDFHPQKAEFLFNFGHPYHRAVKAEKFGEYHLYSLGDPGYLLPFLDPDLLNFLQTDILGTPLGSWLNSYRCKNRLDWQVIVTNNACGDGPEPLEVKSFRSNLELASKDNQWILGPVSKPLCDLLVKAYQKDFDRHSENLVCLNEYSFVYPSGILK